MNAKRPDAIVPGSMGNLLDPPGFPTHSLHVETDRNRRKCNRGGVSISTAATCQWISEESRTLAAELIEQWHNNRPALECEPVKAWISQVLGYFRHCYIPDSGSRNASDLMISKEIDPVLNPGRHAGVAFIRDFYPEFVPTSMHFVSARWGS